MNSKVRELDLLRAERDALHDVWAQEVVLEEMAKLVLKKKNKEIIYYADLIRNKDIQIENLKQEMENND